MQPILVATDLSVRSQRAVQRAAVIARATGRPLHLMCAVGDGLDAVEALSSAEDAAAHLTRASEDDAALGDLEITVSAETGRAEVLIPQVAEDRDAALVVLGGHRNRGLRELFGTPTLVRIVRSLDRPALVAVASADVPWRRVVVGWDFSSAAKAALALAGDLAPDADIEIVHATHEPYDGLGPGVVAPAMSETERARLTVEIKAAIPEALLSRVLAPRLAIGAPLTALDNASADLVAVGRHGRTGVVRAILGETSTDLMLHARRDLLIAPPVE